MHRCFKTIALASIWLGVSSSAWGKDSTMPTQAIELAKQKYNIAQTLTQVKQDCSSTNMRVNDVVYAVAENSAKLYGDFLKSNGRTSDLAAIDTSIATTLKTNSCNTIRQNATFKQIVQQASFLINESLHALSVSNLTECGELNKASFQTVMAEANKIAASMHQRPDFAYLEPMANAQRQRFKELCSGFMAGDYLLLSLDPTGDVLIEMIKLINAK